MPGGQTVWLLSELSGSCFSLLARITLICSAKWRLWEKLGLEIHAFLALNEFQPNGKQGEAPLQPQIQTQEGPGAKRRLHPAILPPLKSPQQPLSKALLNLHFAGCSTYLWCSHRERKLGPHSRVQVSPHPWIQGSPTPESR